MRMIFFNIAWMKYYKGVEPDDKPIGGGSYVDQNGTGSEVFNFCPTDTPDIDISGYEVNAGKYCLGFAETNSTGKNKTANQLHIERLEGCQAMTNVPFIDDVLAIYCATNRTNPESTYTTVAGWYRHATVFRDYQGVGFNNGAEQWFNVIAKAENCVLLPISQRSRIRLWNVPRRNTGASFGFGRSNIWYADDADNIKLQDFKKKLADKILNYHGENWINNRSVNES